MCVCVCVCVCVWVCVCVRVCVCRLLPHPAPQAPTLHCIPAPSICYLPILFLYRLTRWACYKKGKVEWEAQTGMCQWSTPKRPVGVLPWTCRTEGKWPSSTLAGKTTLTNGLLLGRSEVLRSLRHYLRTQSQGHHTIDHLVERGVERRSVRRSSLKGRECHRQSDEHWNRFKGNGWGNFLETWWSPCGLFRAHRYHLELNWIVLPDKCFAFMLRKQWPDCFLYFQYKIFF